MEWQQVPPALAEVVAPLREADEYQRLQLQRQRGVYNLLTGLPGFFLLFMFGLPARPPFAWLLMVISWGGFFWACSAPKSLLPFIRRRRPDWESPLVDSFLLNKALEKLFWLQAPAVFGTWIVIPFVLVASFVFDIDAGWLFLASCQTALLAVAAASLGLQARRQGDRLLMWLFAGVALSSPLFLVAPHYFAPAMFFLGAAVVFPPLLAGGIRLLSPRRWLVR